MRWIPVLVVLACGAAQAAEMPESPENDDPWVREAHGPAYFAVDASDVDASVAWYRTALGVEVIDDTAAEDGRWRIVNLGNETFAIELIWDRRSEAPEPDRRYHGLRKIGIAVPDVRIVAERVEATTGEPPRVVEFEPHRVRLLQVRDPDGNIIQLQSSLDEMESDEAILLRMHRNVLRSHFENDLESWLASEGDDYVSANGGEISYPTPEERREQRGPYLESTSFTEYRDLVDPVVRVSADGTLGWVICQVQIAGAQRREGGEEVAIGSVWAWIELYEKRDGEWLRVGNVSNRRPD